MSQYPPVASVAIRKNYTVHIPSNRLAVLISALQKSSTEVYPVVVCTIEKTFAGGYIMEAIVGTVDPNNIYSGGAGPPDNVNANMSTNNQSQMFEWILKRLNLEYTIGTAVHVISVKVSPGIPGAFLAILKPLTDADITILACYESPPPYILPPVPCPGSITGFVTGNKGYVFKVPAGEAEQAYQILLGVLG